MMRIAVIAAADLPIPAVKGGATETLVTHLLSENSIYKQVYIDVYSRYDSLAEQKALEYDYTNIVFYKPNRFRNSIDKIVLGISRIMRILTKGKTMQKYGFIRFCAQRIKNNAYDLVLLEGNTMYARQLRHLISEKMILHIHSDMLNAQRPTDREQIVQSIDGIISVSDYEKERITSLSSTQRLPIHILKNTINTNLFKPSPEGMAFRNQFRKEHGINENDFLIIYCGRIVEEKGILELIHAVKQMNHSYKLLVVGSFWFGSNKKSSYMQNLEKSCLDIMDRIFFTGYIPQEELPMYYQASDMAVYPSRYNETAGLVVLEALACGVPVIVPNFAGMAEYAPDISAIKIDTRNNCVKEICDALNYLETHQDRYEEMKKNAVSSVQQYNLESYYHNFIDILGLFDREWEQKS